LIWGGLGTEIAELHYGVERVILVHLTHGTALPVRHAIVYSVCVVTGRGGYIPSPHPLMYAIRIQCVLTGKVGGRGGCVYQDVLRLDVTVADVALRTLYTRPPL
jgi:hypothetical protein